MDPSSSEKEITRVEQKLDATKPLGTKRPASHVGPQAGKPHNRMLDAVLVTALLLFVVSAVLVFAGRLTPNQRMQLTAGTTGGAFGLLVGYGVGRLKP